MKRSILVFGMFTLLGSVNAVELRTGENVNRAVIRRMAEVFKQVPVENREAVLQRMIFASGDDTWLCLPAHSQANADSEAKKEKTTDELMVKVGLRNQDGSIDADMLKVVRALTSGPHKGRLLLFPPSCPIKHSAVGGALRSVFGGCSGHRLAAEAFRRG